ncbi:MAG: hypothetical protein JOZ19_03785 [Rubrobacter sp.]|nr:hypothetical protein [Rubrobacter sp.]
MLRVCLPGVITRISVTPANNAHDELSMLPELAQSTSLAFFSETATTTRSRQNKS